MLNAYEAQTLLDKLCVELGFCLPPQERARLVRAPPDDVITFTDAVFNAEGLNPEMADRHLYRKVRDYVAAAFRNRSSASDA